MSLRWMFASAALALTSAAAAAAALAQPAPPPAPAAPPPGSHSEIIRSVTDDNGQRTVTIERDGKVVVEHSTTGHDGHGVREQRRVMVMNSEHRREHEADHLRAILQLRPNQEPALQAYLAALHPAPMEHGVIHAEPGADHPKTTTERLADEEKMLAEHDARIHARLDAVRKFYGQLDPAQKKAFDELPPMEHGMMGPMMIRVNMPHMEMHMHGMPPMPPMPPLPPTPPSPDDSF